jgi:CBS domain-containing protein
LKPRSVTDSLVREVAVLDADQPVGAAVEALLESGLPALPVVDAGRFAGVFGEREFMAALFPGYLGELKHAGFVTHALDDALEKNQACRAQPIRQHMNTEHVDVGVDHADAGVAETFLHHRVLIVPVTDGGRVVGVITRSDFFQALARRFMA